MLKFFSILIITAIAAGAQVANSGQSLSFSNIVLKLGDSEQLLLDRLRPVYTVKTLEATTTGFSNYIVVKKQGGVVGVLTFRNGKLVKAYRDWTPDDPSAYKLVLALKGAFESLNKAGPCQLDTSTVQEPNYLNQSSYIVCGHKYIEVSGIESSSFPQGPSVSIYEWMNDLTTGRK
jgi:hypothetical protein